MNRKFLYLIIAIIILSTIFVSCGTNNDTDTTEPPEATMEIGDIVDNGDGTMTKLVNVNNPILGGYHADPSAYKFGDTYYIYATTDGYVLNGNAGWPMIWKSKNFVDWEANPMELLTQKGNKFTDANSFFWAPSMLNWNDKYYLFFTQGDYFTMVAEGDNPEGPFTVLGNLFETTNNTWPKNKTIDAQAFLDDDNKAYLTYLLRENDKDGDKVLFTAICELDPDNLTKVKHIEKIEELSHSYREGQEIVKKDNKYYMFYSEGSWMDGSYHVKYAVADSIYGPYSVKSTILESPGDGRIIGTGHHSTLKDGDRYIMVYHRQSIPFLGLGFRQVCADEIFFNEDGTIEPVKASTEGIAIKITEDKSYFDLKNVAVNCEVSTPSKIDSKYRPENLVDNDYTTLWKSESKNDVVVTLDLKDVYEISKTEIYFEYSSKYYYYMLEISTDGENWEVFADHTEDKIKCTPRIDKLSDGLFKSARFVRLSVTGVESMSRNYGSKAPNDPARWQEPVRIGIFELKVFSK